MRICVHLAINSTLAIKSTVVTSSSIHRNHIAKPYFSSHKFCSPTEKINGEYGPIFFGCSFYPASTSRLAAASDSTANTELVDDEKSAIQLPGDLRPELMPKHIAVIMDGNGRWATKREVPIQHGHYAGMENLKKLVLQCCKFRVKVLTVYVFSTENWNRSKEEVDFLMILFKCFIQGFVTELITGQDLRFSVIGEKSRLSQSLQSTISFAEESAKSNKGMHFVMALSYGGRHDITEACRKIGSKVEHGILRAKDINEDVFEQQLLTNITEFSNVDLLIRTSGELRISNFLLWQLAYSEFYFPNKLFPDFQETDFIDALNSFQQRQRRFGERKN